MPVIAGGLAASLGMEAAAVKQVESVARMARQAFRGMNLVSDVGEEGLGPAHIVRGLTITRPLDAVNGAMKVFEPDMPDSLKNLDGAETLDLKTPDHIGLDAKADETDDLWRPDSDGPELDSIRAQIRDDFLAKREQLTKAERSPGKMAREAAERIAEISPSQAEWVLMSPVERLAVLKRCFSVLGEEACLPRELIERTEIGMEEMNGANAFAVFFIEEDNSGTWFTAPNKPYIAIAAKNLENPDYSFDDCVSTLYHETMHVLQQQCLLETGDTVPYIELKEEWAAAIRGRVNGTDGYNSKYINYLSNSLEIFAIQQKELFRLMLDCYQSDMR